MKPMACFRAAAAAMLAGSMLMGLPAAATLADAAWVIPDGAMALDAAASWLPPLTREDASPAGAGEGPSATLSVNVAIIALGSLWLVLMARRIQGRSAVDGMAGQIINGQMLSGGMLSSAAPRHVAGGR